MQSRRLDLRERVMQLSAGVGRALVAVGGLVACVAACNGTSSSGGFGFGGPDTIGGGSAGPDISAPLPPNSGPFSSSIACPANLPSDGEPCGSGFSPVGVCEYGGAADPSCNTIARCNPDQGAWTFEQPTHCPTTCPDHFDERVPGASCSGAELCTYLEATCGCAGAIDGAWTSITGGSNSTSSDAGADASTADGGDAGPPAVGQWQCVRPGNGCPARRPVAGSHCTKAMDCDYGTCVFGVPLAMTCIDETWTALHVGSCP